jgi:drug/metabolite transporter (DMT)-like permease
MTETLRFEMTATLLASLAWSVLVMSIAAIALLLLMIRHGELSRVAALIYLVPPLTVLEAYILFGESLDAVQIAGVAVTVIGVWLATRRNK